MMADIIVENGQAAVNDREDTTPTLSVPNAVVGTEQFGPYNSATPGNAQFIAANRRSIDHRIRLRPQDAAIGIVYGETNTILAPLYETNGLIFPYTPTIAWTSEVSYTEMSFTHSNQDFYGYNKTPNKKISISGPFTVQNIDQGRYAIAAIHFLRTVEKMHFGLQDPWHGLPPPVLLLSGYGNYMFNDIRVIVTGWSLNLDASADYIRIPISTPNPGEAWIPSIFTLTINLTAQMPPRRYLTQFNLNKFRTGELISQSYPFNGWH